MVRAGRLGGASRRAGGMARAALAAALVLGMLPASASGDAVSPTWVVNPTVKTVSRLEAPKPWVGTREVHENRTLNTDVVEGTLALGGTFALVIRDDALPALPPVNPAFTIAMRVFLTHDPTHDTHVGLFWKGRGNDDRTPSAWLAPGSTHVTFRVSTTFSTEVWGTANTPLPVRQWCHIAFSVEGRIMRFYVNGALDAAVEIPGEVVTNDGNLHVGKDPANPGLRGFVGAVQMHALALRDEDIQQMAARALHFAPHFDGEPEREARVAARLATEVQKRFRKQFQAVFDANAATVTSSLASVGTDASGMTTTDFVRGAGVTEEESEKNAENENENEKEALSFGRHEKKYDALDADHLASFAEEQFALGDAARASALKLGDASRHAARSRVAAERVMATAVEPLFAAAAGGHAEARLVLAAMLEGGYGAPDSVPKPGRALYHRLMAAASGDPMARLAMGAATVLGNDAFLSGADLGTSRSPPRLSVARCALALHYFYHSATTAHEDSARPGGQARVERGRLHENTRRVKGDLRGESDDRVLYLSRAADLGDARAMLAMGNGYYWGNFGLPRDHEAALRFYRRAHRAGALQGTVGVAKMVLKGEGAPRNASEALEHYRAAAERGSADALNGLGYLYFYGEDVDDLPDESPSLGSETSEGSSSSSSSREETSGKTSSGKTKIQKNDTLALEYFRRAAELGNGDGLVNAGTMLRSGLGAPADVAAAHALFARCAELPGEHPACSYQAALIEASGEGGIPRDCDLAVARLRRVAEGGQWMAPLQEGMKAHLAGRKNEAAWLYEYASASSLPAASFNAAWLGERDARDARVARRFGFGADDEDDEDDEATARDERDENADPAREIAAVAFSREKRAATSLRRHASRVRADSAADDAMRSWAALQLADCEYYGASRPGGCAPGSKRKALRLYREAAASARAALALSDPRAEPPARRARRAKEKAAEKEKEKETQPAPSREEQEAAARAAEDAGGSLDARRLLTHALYAEAWMRAKGEACSADRERAKRALGEALDVGGWRELVAVAPPSVGLALLDLADAACAFFFAFSGPKRGSCAESLMAFASSFVGGDAASGLPDDHANGEKRAVGSRNAKHKSLRSRSDASSDAETREHDAPLAQKKKKKSLSPGAFGLRLVSELIAAASAWEDAVAEHAERWRFTLALSWSLLMATVGFAVGWRLVVRPLVAALYGERALNARERRADGGLDRVARGDHGGGVIGEMRRRVERMRAEAAAEAENRRRVLSEASEASEASRDDARRTNDDAARRETDDDDDAARRETDDDDDEDDAGGDGAEDFLSGWVASAVSSAVQRVTAPPAAERAPFDLGDLDDSSVGGHAVIRGRRVEEDR